MKYSYYIVIILLFSYLRWIKEYKYNMILSMNIKMR